MTSHHRLPRSPGLREAEIRSIEPTLRSESLSGKVQVRSRGFQRWAMRLRWPDLRIEEAMPIRAFLAQMGMHTDFTVQLPDYGTGIPDPLPAANTSQDAEAGDDELRFAGALPWPMRWHYFTVAGHDKVYLAVDAANVITPRREDRYGAITVHPPLRVDVDAGKLLTFGAPNVWMRVRQTGKAVEWTRRQGALVSIETEVEEVL